MDKYKAFDIARNGSLWLASLVEDNGKFVYGYDIKTRKHIKGYNILRHQGSIWAMLDVYKETKDKVVFDAAERALHHMIEHYVKEHESGFTVVVEDREVKLGAAGLGALALLRYCEIEYEVEYIKLAKRLCDYIVSCIRPSGRFECHKRDFDTFEDTYFESEFYIGEALLALMAYDTRISKSVDEGPKYFGLVSRVINWYKFYRDLTSHSREHWMMQVLEYFGRNFWDYATEISKKLMGDPLSWKGGPTACRSEALLSYLGIIDKSIDLAGRNQSTGLTITYEHILGFIEMLLDRQTRCYIRYGEDSGAFRLRPDSNEVRNDYCQHNISSMIRYYRIIKND